LSFSFVEKKVFLLGMESLKSLHTRLLMFVLTDTGVAQKESSRKEMREEEANKLVFLHSE